MTADAPSSSPKDLVTSRLIVIYQDELRRFAQHALSGERPGHTLQPTALIGEAWLKLGATGQQREWDSRSHFFGAMARAMRQVLVDQANSLLTQKRGGRRHRESFSDGFDVAERSPSEVVLDIHEAIEALEKVDPQRAKLVTLRFFGGLTHAEAGAELGISEATAKRHLESAKKFLIVELRGTCAEWIEPV